jgi:metal-responsive CopG/Arc/MetJ family transcriptional regulator
MTTDGEVASAGISGYPAAMAKILVSIDDKLLRRIDRAARALGLTRSAYLSRIAARDVGAERGPGTDQRARRAMAQLDRLFQQQSHPEDATIAIRAERDSR